MQVVSLRPKRRLRRSWTPTAPLNRLPLQQRRRTLHQGRHLICPTPSLGQSSIFHPSRGVHPWSFLLHIQLVRLKFEVCFCRTGGSSVDPDNLIGEPASSRRPWTWQVCSLPFYSWCMLALMADQFPGTHVRVSALMAPRFLFSQEPRHLCRRSRMRCGRRCCCPYSCLCLRW